MHVEPLRTARLTLIASTPELLQIELASYADLGVSLGAEVPPDWPPGEYDRAAMEFFLEQLTTRGSDAIGWFGWYAVRNATVDRPAALVGGGGYIGLPDIDG